MSTFTTYIDAGRLGEELPVLVHYDYDAGQEEILNPVDSAQEYIAASCNITSITAIAGSFYGADITEMVTDREAMEEACLDDYKD